MNPSTNVTRRFPWPRFARHYLEMVLAMIAGMIVLGWLESLLFVRWGWADLLAAPTGMALVMATNMVLGMVVVMIARRHGRRSIAEMTVVMYLPFLLLLPLVWAGAMSAMAMMVLAHVLMFVGMAALMLVRRSDFLGDGHA